MPRPHLGRTRVQITLPPDMLEELHTVFGHTSRSTLIEIALRQLIDRTRAKPTSKPARRKLDEFPAPIRDRGDSTRLETGGTHFSGHKS